MKTSILSKDLSTTTRVIVSSSSGDTVYSISYMNSKLSKLIASKLCFKGDADFLVGRLETYRDMGLDDILLFSDDLAGVNYIPTVAIDYVDSTYFVLDLVETSTSVTFYAGKNLIGNIRFDPDEVPLRKFMIVDSYLRVGNLVDQVHNAEPEPFMETSEILTADEKFIAKSILTDVTLDRRSNVILDKVQLSELPSEFTTHDTTQYYTDKSYKKGDTIIDLGVTFISVCDFNRGNRITDSGYWITN